jgi:hypothetical protein
MGSGEIAGRAVLVLMDRVGDRVVRMACDPVARDPEVRVVPVPVAQVAVVRGRAEDGLIIGLWRGFFSQQEREQRVARV